MKYIYLNTETDKIILIANKKIENHPNVEYVVSDSFDLTKEIETGVFLEGFLTATEFLDRYKADYVSQRVAAYPPMEDYLDAIVKDDSAAIAKYKSDCLAVKAAYPKG
jgi:hypothetical protein